MRLAEPVDRSSEDRPTTVVDHGRGLRLDIEGMRAIAVGIVLAFHAGLPWFAGGFVGVDMFFVLSGFLITGLLAREVARTGRVRLGTFWARRARRLLPASATVLAFSALVSWAFLPITQRSTFGGDIGSAALYVVNWRLADRSVDYLAEDIGASPVQHFWSLAVEEQFYLIWPVLMLLVAALGARRWRKGAFIGLFAITVASFGWAVAESHGNPAAAFFVSTTRIWELGMGALLALSAARVARLPEVLRAAAGWVGLLAIAYAVFFFSGDTVWPGTATLVPTVGALLMIASGIAPTAGSPQRLLSLAPMVWIGGLSYSLYLWHWPILIGAEGYFGDLRLRYTVLLVLLSFIPAWLCHKLIENPIRFGAPFRPTSRALGLGAALTAAGVGIGFALGASAGIGTVTQVASKSESLGARAIALTANADVDWGAVRSVDRMRPLPLKAPEDRPSFYDDRPECQVALGDPVPELCESGDPSGDKTAVIVGDSKLAQWQTSLSRIATRQGWKIVQFTKSGCAFAGVDRDNGGGAKTDCSEWGQTVLDDILEMKPDLVITSNRHNNALPQGKTAREDQTPEAMREGLANYWETMTGAGIPVVALLDNPSPSNAPVYECVARHAKDLTQCRFDRAKGILGSGAPTQRAAAAEVPGVRVVDMADLICPDEKWCPAVIGNVLIYRQGSHLTDTYIDSLEDALSARLSEATDGQFGRSSR